MNLAAGQEHPAKRLIRTTQTASAKEIVFVAGRDPIEIICGDLSYVRAHTRAAIRGGFAPHIFCAYRRTETIDTDFGVLHRVASPFRPFRFLMLPGHGPLIAAAIERFLLEREGPHLIHSFGVWGYIGLLAGRKLRRRGHQVIPLVNVYTTMEHEAIGKLHGLNSAHDLGHHVNQWIEYAWIKLVVNHYERRTCLQSHLVLANYESVREMCLVKYGGMNFRKLVYAAEAAFLYEDTAAPLAAPEIIAALQPPDAPLVVAVSRQDPRKGIDILLHTLARLRASGVAFRACLVGGGPLLAAHRRLAEQLGLGETTILTGWVPDPFPYLKQAEVFALPSLEEGSGSVALLEALQAGAPVVASNLDGIPEDLTDGDNALLVTPGNIAELSRALARVLTDAALRQRLARRARETFLEKFSADIFVKALGEVYAELGFESDQV